METKKFISGLGQNKEITNFLQNENLIDFALMNVIRGENGELTFTTIADFHKIETHTLDLEGQKAFEMFGQFRSSKNAIACILKAIEDKKPINDDTFNNQSKLTPKNYDATIKGLNSFGAFWNWATPETKEATAKLADNWMKGAGFMETMFDFNFINGENGLTLKPQQIIRLYDPIYGQQIYSMVFQASPNGLVTCIDDGGVFTLSAESVKKLEIIETKKAPEEVQEFFGTAYKEYTEETGERKTARLERAIKLNDAKILADKKAEELAEKRAVGAKALQAKKELSEKEKAKLDKLSLATNADIDKLVALIGKKDEVLTSADKKALTDKIKAGRLALKATPKAESAPKATTPATPEAKPTRQRRATAPTAQPATIEEIIKEDALSENPILA